LDKEAVIDMEMGYLKHLHAQSNIKFEVEEMIHEELAKGNQISEEGIEARIGEVERAIRAQQAQNKIIHNQYEKLMNLVESSVKKTVQVTLMS
jgi:hypothetical protein